MKKNYFVRLFGIIILVGIVIAISYAALYDNLQHASLFHYIIDSIIVSGGIWLGCVSIVYLLWKYFPWERTPIKHLIIEIIVITLYVIVFEYIHNVFVEHWTKFPERIKDVTMPPLVDSTINLLVTYLITAIHEAAFFYRQWVFNFSKSAKLEKDNIEAKYATLKSQVNPHFLFNSLNSLSFMVDKNDDAVHYIENLSDVMRYILKSNENELVMVRDETQLLNKYLELQKSRFQESLIIDIDIEEKYYHYQVPPLAVQMIVENAIKHNIISQEKPLTIKVKAEKESIFIVNNLQKKEGVQGTGQGLKNISERYAFFSSRKLEIRENKDTFTVTLPLLTVSL